MRKTLITSLTIVLSAFAPTAFAMTAEFAQSQISPVTLTTTELQTILEERGTQTPYVTTSGLLIGGETADVVKIVDTGLTGYRYLAVYHHLSTGVFFNANLAYSNDLINWTKVGAISTAAGMPDIRILSDGSILYAHERNPSGTRPYIEVRYYGTTMGFITHPSAPDRSINLPFTANASADGTPDINAITYNGDINQSVIDISYHFFQNSVHDQQAKGTLTNFATWTGSADTSMNQSMLNLGYVHLGGRELLKVGSTVYELLEANTVTPSGATGWDLWKEFLINKNTGEIRLMTPLIPGGAYSLGNPQASFLTLPDGRAAIALSYYIFGEGRASTPGGPHLYIYPLSTGAMCTPLPGQVQTLSCPPGQTGAIKQTRSSSCPVGATAPVWTAWTTVSNSCSNDKIYESENNNFHATGSLVPGGWQVTSGQNAAGHMQYGPYATDWGDSPATTVIFNVALKTNPGGSANIINMDVNDVTTGTILGMLFANPASFGSGTTQFAMPINLAGRAGHTMEARVWWYGAGSVMTDYVRVHVPQSCTFNGQTVQSGSSVTAYQTGSVPYGQTCASQVRTCTDGVLSGTYTVSSCTVAPPASCTFNGQTIAHGASVTAYLVPTVPFGQTCTSQSRTCSNGTLSGTYANSSCTVDAPYVKIYESENNNFHATGSLVPGGWQVTSGQNAAGHMQYGPYATDWGSAPVNVTYNIALKTNPGGSANIINMDVYDGTSGSVLGTLYATPANFGAGTTQFTLPINLTNRAGHTMEARVWWYGAGSVMVDSVKVAQ